MSSDSRQQVWDVFAKALSTFDQKNADYGDAWRTNGWRGNLSRIFEKVQRVRNLAWRPDPRVPAVGDEQVLETLQDLLNTTAFTIINMIEGVEYGHETPRSQRISVAEQDYVPGAATSFFDQVGAELPHVQANYGTPVEPGTQRIMVDPKAVEMNEELSKLEFQTGPDEQSSMEKKHDRVARKPRPNAVRDTPQA